MRAGSSCAEHGVGRRIGEPVELAEDDQRVVADPAGQGAEAPQGAHEASRRRVRGRGGRPREPPPQSWTPARGTRTNRRPREAASARANAVLPMPGGPQETQDDGVIGGGAGRVTLCRGPAGHQVVDHLILLAVAADMLPVERPPQRRRRAEPFLRPPPRQLLHHLDPGGGGDRRGVGGLQARDAGPLARQRVTYVVGQRVVPRRSQDLGHGDVRRPAGSRRAASSASATMVTGAASLFSTRRHATNRPTAPSCRASSRTPASHVWPRITSRIAASVISTPPAGGGGDAARLSPGRVTAGSSPSITSTAGGRRPGAAAAGAAGSPRVTAGVPVQNAPALNPLTSSWSAQSLRRTMATFSSSLYPDASMTSSRSRSGAGNPSQVVGRRDEQHLGQVERDVHVDVPEVRVLLGVEQLEQGGRRVAEAPRGAAHLVDLVLDHHGVADLGVQQPAHDPPRLGRTGS